MKALIALWNGRPGSFTTITEAARSVQLVVAEADDLVCPELEIPVGGDHVRVFGAVKVRPSARV